MIAGLLLLGLAAAPAPAPSSVLVATARGDIRLPVRHEAGAGPAVAAPGLLSALGGSAVLSGAWAAVDLPGYSFRLLVGAPFYSTGVVAKPLVGSAVVVRDTLFLPLHFVTHVIPAEVSGRYRYLAGSGRLEEIGGALASSGPVLRSEPAVAAPPTVRGRAGSPRPRAVTTAADGRLPNGLHKGHVVAVDPGHGGVDPGNPGLHFPKGITEADVNLQVGLLLRQELLSRGVGVIMTRTTDTLIELRDRGGYCTESCQLFVSLHVNSLPRRAGYNQVRGFETYFLAQAKTEDAARVARMENEAIRFESANGSAESVGGLDFILKDLQLNEYLRESARLAELMQSHVAEVHSGPNRGVKQTSLYVLNSARRPAVLFEMGFATNPQDARIMTQRTSQRNLAASIADAIVAYLLEYQERSGSGAVSQSGGGQE